MILFVDSLSSSTSSLSVSFSSFLFHPLSFAAILLVIVHNPYSTQFFPILHLFTIHFSSPIYLISPFLSPPSLSLFHLHRHSTSLFVFLYHHLFFLSLPTCPRTMMIERIYTILTTATVLRPWRTVYIASFTVFITIQAGCCRTGWKYCLENVQKFIKKVKEIKILYEEKNQCVS